MKIHPQIKHSIKPRKMKNYFFEFFVIFIAIIGGFFADNIRERFIDRHAVKEYMESLVQDLKADTMDLSQKLLLNKNLINGLDSLQNTMEKPLIGDNLKKFYQYNLQYTVKYHPFMPTNRTIVQLMNTGGLRLIRKKSVSDSIVIYDQTKVAAQLMGEFLGNQISDIIDEEAEIIDVLAFVKSSSASNVQNDFPALLTSDNKTISSYYFKIIVLHGTLQTYYLSLEELKKQATSLIHQIEKEFKVE